MPPVARSVLGRVSLWLAQSPVDAERLGALGARRAIVCGNLKFDVPPPAADPSAVAALRAQIGARPVFVAASTHPGEEEAGHRRAQGDRRPASRSSSPSWRRAIRSAARRSPRRSLRPDFARAAARPASRFAPATDILLADTIGEMGLWYRLADVAFLGGSMVARIGGQNPIEPAKLGVPVLHGRACRQFPRRLRGA